MFELKDGDWRMTVHCIQHGQPRPYADHIYVNQVYFEWIPYDTRVKLEDKKYEPVKWPESMIKQKLQVVQRFYETKDMPDPFAPELKYIKQLGPGLWEFEVRERFTD